MVGGSPHVRLLLMVEASALFETPAPSGVRVPRSGAKGFDRRP